MSKKIENKAYYNAEELKNISIIDYCNNNNIILQKAGKYYNLKEHDSLMINPKNNTFFWYSRERGGSIIQFIQEYYNIEYYNALKI